MASEGAEDHDLDDLLDSALEDFQKVDGGRSASKDGASSSTSAPESSGAFGMGTHDAAADEARTVGQGLGLGLPERKKGVKKSKVAAGGGASGTSRGAGGAQPSGTGTNVAATIEKLAQQTRQAVEGVSPELPEGVDDEEALEKLVQQFEQLGNTQDMQSLMDGVMHHLLSKEILHQPMQEIGARYPAWLEANKATLSDEDFKRYSQQFEYIKQLCHAYENTPNDFNLIIELMQQMQNCGQPPQDIVKELAPGMDFGDDGMPMLPEMFGAAGENPQQCSVM